jgi:DNA-3-methyladenine glycosylase I
MKAMAGVDVPAHLPIVVTAADGITRCRWATETGRDLTAYHDHEWGIPTHDEDKLFETLVLTYFENGLSWATVFDKRDNLRKAFHDFDPAAVAAMTSDDVERLMADTSIIRNRRKIEATLHNARLLSKHSLSELVWQHQPATLLAALREKGFRMVGPVVAHSFMQTVGIENGHFDGCFLAPSHSTSD